MKKLYSLSALWVLVIFEVSAQSPAWKWAKTDVQAGSISHGTSSLAATTDLSGNVYSTGSFFDDSISFGSYSARNTDGSGQTGDIFIVKYDPNGNPLWVTSAGGMKNESATSITTDKNGNIYVAGWFYSDSVKFGSVVIRNYGPTDTADDIFLVKLSPAGVVLWAEAFGGNHNDAAYGISTDPSGNVFIGGSFSSDSIQFGLFTLPNLSFGGLDRDDVFLAKCDSSGHILWANGATTFGGASMALGVSTDVYGNSFITGRFHGVSLTLGTEEIYNNIPQTEDIFLIKFDSTGNAVWGQDAGGNQSDEGRGIAIDGLGNIYVTGYYRSNTAYFGSNHVTNTYDGFTPDIFLAKYDASGNALWVVSANGDSTDVGTSVSTDSNDNIYITGFFYSAALGFSSDSIHNSDQTETTSDIFLAEYSSSGNLIGATSIGGANNDSAYCVTSDMDGNIYVSGNFTSSNVRFGTITLNNSGGNNEAPFTAKYRCDMPSVPIITQSGDTLVSSSSFGNQWFKDGIAIAGATNQIYVDTLPGTYTYSVEVIGGPTCMAASTGITITTAIKSELELPAISLYPNPGSNFLVAQSKAFIAAQVTVTVYDVAGRRVPVDYTTSANAINFSVIGLAAGMYWLKFNINGKEATTKFVKVASE